MQHLNKNIKKIATIFIVAFCILLVYFIYAVNVYGVRWFTNPHNKRLTVQRANVTQGDIIDRNGVVLAKSQENERVYLKDDITRAAVGHVVGDSKGKISSGAESFMAKYLLGFDRNIINRIGSVISGVQHRGSDVSLTIDSALSKYILQVMDEHSGSIVVMNYMTGEILAMVNNPSFDPNFEGEYAAEQSNFVNRAIMGKYTPGSVFKLVTAACAIRNIPDVLNRTFICDGPMVFSDEGQYLQDTHISPEDDKLSRKEGAVSIDVPLLRDYQSQYHNEINLETAFSKSCNNVFAKLALELGKEKLAKTAAEFGFGDDFMFSDTVLYSSQYIPGDTDFTLGWSAVGQHKDIVTPLQMAMICASIANNGIMMEPKMLYKVNNELKLQPKKYSIPLTADEADVIKSFMRTCVKSGTSKQAAIKNFPVCGKTGTAEVASSKDVGSHAWFVGFIDDTIHPIAVSVVLEHAGSGGSIAAPVASKIFSKAIDLGY